MDYFSFWAELLPKFCNW